MRIGVVSTVPGNPNAGLDELVAEAKAAEARGFAFLSVPNIFGLDAIGALTVVGRETERIELATGVVPTPPRHPTTMAQQALTAQAASGGRFVLGIGLSHKIVIEDMLGLSYAKPALQMREYLEVLMPLVQGRAALGPRMLKVAGTLADGTATWMTGLKTLASHTVPSIGAAAKEAGRPEPRVIAALPIALTNDPDGAREVAGRAFQIYGSLPSYRAMLDREGAAGPGDVAIVGSESDLRTGLRQLAEAGVTDFAASVYAADGDAVERSTAFLESEL
jgi:alkanesulfonate monooxygenase SsuD/methylene tetrahydromethanopterin reductase-like flavin-dependent oxidoreductase (luciferase family)